MANVIGQFFKNLVTQYSAMAVSMLVMFFFTPFLISQLGKEQYGVWSLIFSIVAYMGLADVGMRQSLVRHVSKYYAVEDWKQVNQVLSSSSLIYSGIFLVIAFAITAIAFGFLDYFKIPDEMKEVTKITLILIGINQGLVFLLIPYSSMGPFHRFDISSYVAIPTLLLQVGSIVLLLLNGYGLIEMAIVVLAVNIIDKTTLIIIRRKLFTQIKFAREYITKEKVKELFNYASISFLIIVATVFIFYTDNILIGMFVSMSGVAVYTIPATIIMQLRQAINGLSVVLVPAISHFDSEGNMGKIQEVYNKSTRYLYFITTYLAICLIIFGGPFILLWVKDAFAESIDILHVLTIPAAIFFPQMIATSILYGISKHKLTFYVMAAEALGNIVLSLILVEKYGVLGVAIGTAIPQIIIYSLVYPILFLRIIKMSVSKFYLSAARSIAIGVVILLPVAYLLREFLIPDNWFNLIFSCLIVTFFMAISLLFIVLDEEDKMRILKKFKIGKKVESHGN